MPRGFLGCWKRIRIQNSFSWIDHFEFCNSDPEFVFSDPKTLLAQIFIKIRQFFKFSKIWYHRYRYGDFYFLNFNPIFVFNSIPITSATIGIINRKLYKRIFNFQAPTSLETLVLYRWKNSQVFVSMETQKSSTQKSLLIY